MLSPVKLYKADQATKRRPVTWGPGGNAGAHCQGSACFRHENLDWTVHRLTPAIYSRGKVGGVRRKALGKVLPKLAGKDDKATRGLLTRRPKSHLQATSPRWGAGEAPGRRPRSTVPLPKKGTVEVSNKTKAAVTGAAIAYGGYKAYQHKDQIREKAATLHDGVHNAFHSTKEGMTS